MKIYRILVLPALLCLASHGYGQLELELVSAMESQATIVVLEKHVEVYMEDRSEPVLKVEGLSPVSRGKIGLWVGNGSSGRFRNLVLE